MLSVWFTKSGIPSCAHWGAVVKSAKALLPITVAHQRESALKVLSRLHSDTLAPEDALGVGRLYLDLEAYEQALTCFRAVLQTNNSLADGHYGAGLALSHLNRSIEAITELNVALRQDPKGPDVSAIHAQLASLYRLSGRKSDAELEEKLARVPQ